MTVISIIITMDDNTDNDLQAVFVCNAFARNVSRDRNNGTVCCETRQCGKCHQSGSVAEIVYHYRCWSILEIWFLVIISSMFYVVFMAWFDAMIHLLLQRPS